MELTWIVLVVVLVCAIALIFFLIRRNQKDKDEVIKYLNETEVEEDDEKPKEAE